MLVQFPNTFKVLLLVTDAEVLIVMFLTFALVEITGLVLTRGIIISLVLVGTVQLFQLALTFQSVLVLPVQVGVCTYCHSSRRRSCGAAIVGDCYRIVSRGSCYNRLSNLTCGTPGIATCTVRCKCYAASCAK